MADALRTKELPEWKAKLRQKRRQDERVPSGAVFENLSAAEKDRLLKVLAIRAGLIEDSEDPEEETEE